MEMLQFMQISEHNLQFHQLTYHEGILDIIEDLIGPNIQQFHNQALNKPPHHGGPIFWHQDNAYWKCLPPANLVSCWLTLDDVDLHNGAMQFIPGSHLRPMIHDQAQGSDVLLERWESWSTTARQSWATFRPAASHFSFTTARPCTVPLPIRPIASAGRSPSTS